MREFGSNLVVIDGFCLFAACKRVCSSWGFRTAEDALIMQKVELSFCTVLCKGVASDGGKTGKVPEFGGGAHTVFSSP